MIFFCHIVLNIGVIYVHSLWNFEVPSWSGISTRVWSEASTFQTKSRKALLTWDRKKRGHEERPLIKVPADGRHLGELSVHATYSTIAASSTWTELILRRRRRRSAVWSAEGEGASSRAVLSYGEEPKQVWRPLVWTEGSARHRS